MGTNRRVPGLRRSEVAALAGVSIEYYTRLERGNLAGASPSVLDGLARALRLDDAERMYLFDLAHAADGTSLMTRPRRKRAKRWTPRPSVSWALDAIVTGPAFIRNRRMDLLTENAVTRAFFSDVYSGTQQPANLARFHFLDDKAREFYLDWDAVADVVVSALRTEAGRDPYDKDLHDLVGELSTRSDEFRTRWGTHNVRVHSSGTKRFHHPIVGEVTLSYESMDMPNEPDLAFTIYTAEPGSPSAQALRLLASWAATSVDTDAT